MPTCYLPLPALTAPEEVFAGMTRVGDAELLNGRQLFIGEVELAQRGIGFAEIFPHLRICRVERDRAEIIADAFARSSELTRGPAAITESASGIPDPRHVEDFQGLLETLRLGERERLFDELAIRTHAAALGDASMILGVPNLAPFASGQISACLRSCPATCASSSAACSPARTSAASAHSRECDRRPEQGGQK